MSSREPASQSNAGAGIVRGRRAQPANIPDGRPYAGVGSCIIDPAPYNAAPYNAAAARPPPRPSIHMISFAGLPPAVAQAMCTPLHLVLPASPSTGTGALYLGSVAAALDPAALAEHAIAHLVQVLDVPWLPPVDPAHDGRTALRLPILDLESEDLRPHLQAAVDDIDAALRAGQNVLVHCQQGVSRSPAIVIAYLIRKRAMSYDAAAALVRARRPCSKPNPGFVRALRDWEAQRRPAPPARPPARTREVLSH